MFSVTFATNAVWRTQGVCELLYLGDYPKHSFYLNFISYLLYFCHLARHPDYKNKSLTLPLGAYEL